MIINRNVDTFETPTNQNYFNNKGKNNVGNICKLKLLILPSKNMMKMVKGYDAK